MCIFLSVSLLGDESRGTDSAKTQKTATLNIKHFSLLGTDKSPENLTLTTDTTRLRKDSHEEYNSRWNSCSLCVIVCVLHHCAHHSAQAQILHSVETAIAWGWTACLIKWHCPWRWDFTSRDKVKHQCEANIYVREPKHGCVNLKVVQSISDSGRVQIQHYGVCFCCGIRDTHISQSRDLTWETTASVMIS